MRNKERKETKNRMQLECKIKAKDEENTLIQKNLKELEFELNSTKENIKVLKENENLLQKENEDRVIQINELLIKYSCLKSEYEEYKLENIIEKMEGNNRKKTNSNQRKNSNSKKMDDSETYSENLNLSEDMNLSKEINICKFKQFTEKNNDSNKNSWPKTVSSHEIRLSSSKKTEVEIVMLP